MAYDEDGSNQHATDIITYIGVPLAVLGVLPILYNFIRTLAALAKIKRLLRHSKLTALTRSDIFNRVIEVELPRYAVQPLDRFDHRHEYWQLSRQPSQIAGGTWTTFNWKTNTIGMKTQRVEYADQLRQPQVDIALDHLVAYMLDLGAVPNAHGWKLLRSTGLWTPMGTALMTSPDGIHNALTIAPLDDSDGHLSLKVEWSSSWTTRNYASLPPYWVNLPPMPPKRPESQQKDETSSSQSVHEASTEEPDKIAEVKAKKALGRESLDSIQRQIDRNKSLPVTCEISTEGLIAALSQPEGILSSTTSLHRLYIEHLRISHISRTGAWFASTATAYGKNSQTILWNYKVPDEILNFSQRDTIPCGILVLLDIVDMAETPDWATTHDNGLENHERFVSRNTEQRLAMAEEAKMAPAQKSIAQANRQRREMEQRMQDMRDDTRRNNQRRDARFLEALQSPKWETTLVAGHCLNLLKRRSVVDKEAEMRDVVGMLLHRMVLDGEFTSSLVKILDLWKAWAENGGMRKSDFEEIQYNVETFAQATLMVAMIKGTAVTSEGTLSMDLQECMRMWRTVRLG